MRVDTVAAAIGLIAAVSYPLITRQTALTREARAVEWLGAIADAQARFRAENGGYSATLASLTEGCSGRPAALRATPTNGVLVDAGHEISLHRAKGAGDGAIDCHGRVTTTDFYASARPIVAGQDGARGLAMTSAGRVFVFVDGVPPAEADIAGGLAMPLDDMSKIP